MVTCSSLFVSASACVNILAASPIRSRSRDGLAAPDDFSGALSSFARPDAASRQVRPCAVSVLRSDLQVALGQ